MVSPSELTGCTEFCQQSWDDTCNVLSTKEAQERLSARRGIVLVLGDLEWVRGRGSVI